MNLSYLTDAQVRAEMIKLLERIDSEYNNFTDDEGKTDLVRFWGDLGYDAYEFPRL
tara:strand:+ start:380 stop:547 length:168 start_codon:yes stop_codon:yes gene_type:complete